MYQTIGRYVGLGVLILGSLTVALTSRLLTFCLRHPVLTGFVLASLLAASIGPWVLIGWLTLGALVTGWLAMDRADTDDGLAIWVIWSLCRFVFWLARHPFTLTAVVALTLVGFRYGRLAAGASMAWLGVVLAVWEYRWPASFERHIGRRVRSCWRSVTVYWPTWSRVLRGIDGLTKKLEDGMRVTPRRLRVTSGPWADRVRTQMIPGQAPEAWEKSTNELAASFGAIDCRVERLDPRLHAVDLVLRHKDPLAAVLNPPALGTGVEIDVTAINVAMRETGAPFCVAASGANTFCAGSMGAGKGSVVGSYLHALAPLNPARLVRLVGIDLKRGMELGMYGDPRSPDRPGGIWYDLAYTPDDAVALLEHVVAEEQARGDRLRGIARKYTLSEWDPLWFVVIDEIAELIHYQPDKKLKYRAEMAISTLAAEGRAPGFSLLVCTQDPRKEIVGFRDLLVPTRIGMRLPGKDITDAAIGDNAYDLGAHCDRIPVHTPGVAYIWVAGQAQPDRVRFYYPDDDHARWLADTYPAPIRRLDPSAVIDTTAVEVEAGEEWDSQDDGEAWAA